MPEISFWALLAARTANVANTFCWRFFFLVQFRAPQLSSWQGAWLWHTQCNVRKFHILFSFFIFFVLFFALKNLIFKLFGASFAVVCLAIFCQRALNFSLKFLAYLVRLAWPCCCCFWRHFQLLFCFLFSLLCPLLFIIYCAFILSQIFSCSVGKHFVKLFFSFA